MTPATPTFKAGADYAGSPCVLYRGCHMRPDECERVLAIFRAEAVAQDYFAPSAHALAEELEGAMRKAGLIEHKEAA